MVTDEDVLGLIRGSTIKACALDPLPASTMRKCYSSLVPIFRRVINLSLSSGLLPKELKVALLSPVLKKLNADFEQFSNFRSASNLRADVSKYRPEVYKSEKSKILQKIHKVALGKLLT